jgi:hypothetical protein
MLAASSSEQKRVLELFDLALRLVQRSGPIPPQLSQHFNVILRQARALAEDPNTVEGDIFPEAIQLALRLRELKSLREAFRNIPDLSSVTPEQAGNILSSLDVHVET